jgi:hypothetical protein
MRTREEKGRLGIVRLRLEDNIKMNYQEIGLVIADWINLSQNKWRAFVMTVRKVTLS